MKLSLKDIMRDALFTNLVVNSAKVKSDDIVHKAQEAADELLAETHHKCDTAADAYLLKQQLSTDYAQSCAVAIQSAKEELFAYRTQLVEEMFAEVQERLCAFSSGDAYGAWLVRRAVHCAKHAGTTHAPTIFLRKEDMCFTQDILSALPSVLIEQDEGIRIGGLKMRSGNRLYDESLDAALLNERLAFTQCSPLTQQL